VRAAEFDEETFFRAIASSEARALLIGRRALVALGLPVLTADYDFWLHIDDLEKFNDAVAACGLLPNRSPEDARGVGRYVVEGDERADVLVARQVFTREGVALRFDDAWARRQEVDYGDGLSLAIPSIADLILTKKWALRPKDIQDIEIRELYETPVSDDEWERIRDLPRNPDSDAETIDLARWFLERYPTAKERFAYVRRKYLEWTRQPASRSLKSDIDSDIRRSPTG